MIWLTLFFFVTVKALSFNSNHLNYVCKPEGSYDCSDETELTKVCIEGYPCEKYANVPSSLSICDDYGVKGVPYHNPYLIVCDFLGLCHSDGNWGPIGTNTERQVLCKLLLGVKSQDDLARACDQTKGHVSTNHCCVLGKPYPVCPEYCKELIHNELVSICEHDDCCTNCEFNVGHPTRQCLSLRDAKNIVGLVVKEYEAEKPVRGLKARRKPTPQPQLTYC